MNTATRKMRACAIRAERKYNRQGEANAREVDAVIVHAYNKIRRLLATTTIPNGAFQQRLRSILYDDMMAKLIVTIRRQLLDAASVRRS